MAKWSAWKSVLAGAVIGFVEAAGPEEARRRLRDPVAVVRIVRQRRHTLADEIGLWLLDPLPRPAPDRGGIRRRTGALLRLGRFRAGDPRGLQTPQSGSSAPPRRLSDGPSSDP